MFRVFPNAGGGGKKGVRNLFRPLPLPGRMGLTVFRSLVGSRGEPEKVPDPFSLLAVRTRLPRSRTIAFRLDIVLGGPRIVMLSG